MRENLASAKLYKLGIKSSAEFSIFRQVGSVSKAISISLSLYGAALSEFHYFGSPEACFDTYLLSFGACLWQERSAYSMGLPSWFRVSGHFFFLLVEWGGFAPLRSAQSYVYLTKTKQLNFSRQNTNQLSPFGLSGLSAVWISLQTPEGLPCKAKHLQSH